MASTYDLKARATPGLLAIAPISVALLSLGLIQSSALTAASALATIVGGTYVISVLVGAIGRGAQVTLWTEWDGPSTTRMLRLRDRATNPLQQRKWRTDITALTGVDLFDEAEERRQPSAADQAIETAVASCRYLGHGGPRGIAAVQAENTQYGFERNLYALRWIGRGLALLAAVGTALSHALLNATPTPAFLTSLAPTVPCLLFWALAPSEKRTRQAADRYAVQLFNAVSVAAHTPS
ncbi:MULTISPECIES: hypothetical protein [unclassified Aeromicrobium]|uniref:hypothetical protein n=1 Tax=unclassified Aeromicrobium TaxID=2633570 RepID=UPI00288A1819|nr:MULTISPECIES: hypothetical protein [unclassified Aeromicrobium]